MDSLIREVTDDDWGAVTAVYNYFVRTSLAAYPDEIVNPDFFRTKRAQFAEFPFLVVEVENTVLGFAYLSPFHFASTLCATAALTYFLHPSITGGGMGTELLNRLVHEGKNMGINNFLANISSHNKGSVRFHHRNGFVECGRFLRVGTKSGQQFDMIWMQRIEENPGAGTLPGTD